MAIGHLNLFILLQTYTTTHIPSSYCRGLEYPLLKCMSLIMVMSIKLIHVPLVRSLNNCVILVLGICVGILWNKDPFRFLLGVEIVKINMKEKIANIFFIKTMANCRKRRREFLFWFLFVCHIYIYRQPSRIIVTCKLNI